MKHLLLTFTMALLCNISFAQESHYRRSLRSQAENDQYGIVGANNTYMGGITSGMYWSRVRDPDDMQIKVETAEDSIQRHAQFMSYYYKARDSFDQGDAVSTLVYGDSALRTQLRTPALFYYMGVAYEQLGHYKEARRSYKQAVSTDYPNGRIAYKGFKWRQKQRKKHK